MSRPPDVEAIRIRMRYVDSLPPAYRAVMNGLPLPSLLPDAIAAGCLPQEDAEEWMRSIVGADCAVDK